jgi:hypothetical protein
VIQNNYLQIFIFFKEVDFDLWLGGGVYEILGFRQLLLVKPAPTGIAIYGLVGAGL